MSATLGRMQSEPTPDQPPTVGAYLREWLDHQRLRLQPTTLKSYTGNLDRYIAPHLGDVALDDLDVTGLERLWTELLSHGGHEDRPLSFRTVEHAAGILRRALGDAVRTGLLDRNVAQSARLPTVDPAADDSNDDTVDAWTAEQARRFLDLIRGDRLHDIWVLALATGMRRGEVLGLRWQDVDLDDLDKASVHVRRALQVVDGTARLKTTKTSRARTVRIDHVVAGTLDRRRRLQHIHREQAGDTWKEPWGLVFTDEQGHHLVPTNVSAAFRALVRKLDVPIITLDALRHTHAILLLEAGLPVKVLSERLGHSSVRVTLNAYGHVLPTMETHAMQRFTSHLYGTGPQ